MGNVDGQDGEPQLGAAPRLDAFRKNEKEEDSRKIGEVKARI